MKKETIEAHKCHKCQSDLFIHEVEVHNFDIEIGTYCRNMTCPNFRVLLV